MRKLFLALILLLASVAAALWFRDHDGFVILTVGPWTLQTSLIVFVGAVVAVWVVLGLVFGILRGLWGTPRGVQRWLGVRRRGKARREVMTGLVQIAEGRYDDAERQLLHHVDVAEVPTLNYLLAAVAAQRRGSWEARDEYLARADREDRRVRLAVGVLQAQLQVDAQQWEQALATLSWLREQAPGNRRALMLLARCAEALQDWDRLAELLPELRRRGAMDSDALAALERRVFEERLNRAEPSDADAIQRAWDGLSKECRREPWFLARYARGLMQADRQGDAEALLRQQLNREWDDTLASLYADVDVRPAEPIFRNTEKWLRQRPEDPILLYAAGCQALRSELWGRARSYLEAAAARTGRAEVHRRLADLYEKLGETEKARRSYRRALGLDPGRSTMPAVEPPAQEQA
ncbi:MAG: heme biosynthesis HemY N-terminal domain-containing protein [Ectothiorhodospiraceae bacterium]|jgi:HemY protein